MPMRRLASGLFTLCSAVSLLLCVAVCGLWLRSGYVRDEAHWGRAGQVVHVASDTGAVLLGWLSYDRYLGEWPDQFWTRAESTGHESYPLRRTLLPPHGFEREWARFTDTQAAGVRGYLFVPYWAVVLTAAAMPALWLGRRVRARGRVGPGCCPACGYDLRATRRRCPECGAAPRQPPHHDVVNSSASDG